MQVVDYLKEQSIKQNFKMPLIVGPERYEPMGDVENCWWKKFLDSGWGERIDIYGTHYYPEHRYYDKLRFELSLIGERPFWATEPHWGSETAQPDILNHAETAICTLWDQTDLGMDGFMWWDYKRAGNLRGCLMRAVSVPLRGARPVEMTDHDGTRMEMVEPGAPSLCVICTPATRPANAWVTSEVGIFIKSSLFTETTEPVRSLRLLVP